MKKETVSALIQEIGILPSVRVNAEELARFAAETVRDAGIPIVEITLTTPGALNVVSDIAKRYPEMAIGTGTVLDAESARRCIDAGTQFITSPGLIPEVVEAAQRANVVVFPGAMTPTEIIAAWKMGSDFVKVYPTAHMGGVPYIKSLKIPLPQIPLIVSGGVNQLTALDYIVAGAAAVGVGGELLPAEALTFRQEKRIHELARRFLAMVKEGRSLKETYY